MERERVLGRPRDPSSAERGAGAPRSLRVCPRARGCRAGTRRSRVLPAARVGPAPRTAGERCPAPLSCQMLVRAAEPRLRIFWSCWCQHCAVSAEHLPAYRQLVVRVPQMDGAGIREVQTRSLCFRVPRPPPGGAQPRARPGRLSRCPGLRGRCTRCPRPPDSALPGAGAEAAAGLWCSPCGWACGAACERLRVSPARKIPARLKGLRCAWVFEVQN